MNNRGPYFLDTNIVMYAIGKDHPHKAPCRAVLEQVERDEIDVVTSVEVLQEILHRYFSLNRPDLAELAYRSLEKSCERILPVTKADLDRAFDLLKIHPDIRSRDAVHAGGTWFNLSLLLTCTHTTHHSPV